MTNKGQSSEVFAALLEWAKKNGPAFLRQVAIFLWENFGDTVVAMGKEQAKKRFHQILSERNILILGDSLSGKTALITYMTTGKPYLIHNNQKIVPDRTLMTAIVDKKVKLDQSAWLRIKEDFPGDIGLGAAHLWRQGVLDLRPAGIIYMLDGRKDNELLTAEIRRIFSNVIAYSKTDDLRALHIFINYGDLWSISNSVRIEKERFIYDLFTKYLQREASTFVDTLQYGTAMTQLSPDATAWPEAERALNHFGAEFSAK
jgi:hypothetical protein